MIGLLVQRFLKKWNSGDSEDADESSGFAGSMLDWSVNYGHGATTGHEASREIAQIQEKAELLDEQDRRQR